MIFSLFCRGTLFLSGCGTVFLPFRICVETSPTVIWNWRVPFPSMMFLPNDNIVAVYWQRKGATTTLGPAAFLLQLQGLHQRFYHYVPLCDYIPGSLNIMANFLSCCWDLTDNELLSYFNSTFPQNQPWRLCHVQPKMNSALTLALSRKRCTPKSILRTPRKRMDIGTLFGWTTDQLSKLIPALPTWTIQSPTSRSLPIDTNTAAFLPAVKPSNLRQFLTSSNWWARGLPAWGALIHV